MSILSNVSTHFSWPIDGSIIGLYLVVVMIAGIMVRKYVGKVEHFLVAGREMNLFLGIASLAATEFGIVTCMAGAQLGYTKGFAGAATPGILTFIAMLVVGITGFCIKPLRDAGVVTIPELFEKQFGSGIRWAAGVVIVLGGLLNMGMFLRIGGEFLINVVSPTPIAAVTVKAAPADAVNASPESAATASAATQAVIAADMPAEIAAKPVQPPAAPVRHFPEDYTLEITMSVLLIFVAIYTIMGGMLSVLVTDFLQFVVMSFGLLAVTILVLYRIGWNQLVESVRGIQGGFNPFENADMGYSQVAFMALVSFAGVLTWQTMISRVLSAKDTRTGTRVYTATSFFFVCRFLIPGLWGIAALAFLPKIGVHLTADDSMQAMPRFLSAFVPVGLMGVLLAAMLAADMSTDSTYMLTWGSVIYNDILAPFRKKGQWNERRGLLWNRLIVALIGLFLLVYGLWYQLEGDVLNYLYLTGTIYMSSMSVMLVACCYWRRANNWGAVATIFLGAVVPVLYLVLTQFWRVPVLDAMGHAVLEATGKVKTESPIVKLVGPAWSGLATFALCGLGMVIGSLLKPKSTNRDDRTPVAVGGNNA